MDGYLRDSRHSWNLRDSTASWNLRDSRQSWSSLGSYETPGPWNTGSVARLVPLQPLRSSASQPSPLRNSHNPDGFSDEFEYQYQNWSQTDLSNVRDQSPRPKPGYHPLRNAETIDNDLPPKGPIKDPNLVTFAGPKDPLNPKNWSKKKKWITTLVVSSYAFISPVSSSIIAPGLTAVARDFQIHSLVEVKLCLSIFVLAYGIGPLFLGPLSEVFGRCRVLQISAAFYLAFNLACGFATSAPMLIAFRFLAGIGGSAPLTIGGGVLGDIWPPAQRGRAVGIYQLAPLLGPAIGPIAGGFISANTTWRWVFYATSMAAGVVQFVGLLCLRETYSPTLLKRKADALRRSTGNLDLHTEFEEDKTLPKVLRTATARPFRLLTTQPIIQLIAVYMAYIFGLFYLLLSTFPNVFEDVYGESTSIAGLNYLALGIGFTLGAQINAHLNIAIYRRLKARNNNKGRPEFRIPQMFVASALIPIGLFWYGWSVYYKLHWIIPDLGVMFFGMGSVICLSCMQVYIIDSYTRYSASGIAAAIVLRSFAGAGFPLFALAMYNKLGYGWANSILGFVAIVFGMPAPYIFWRYGEYLRSKSTFAIG